MAMASDPFTEQATFRGLKDITVDTLRQYGYDNIHALAIIGDDDLKVMGFTIGQKVLIKKWAKEISKSVPNQPNTMADLVGADVAVLSCQETFLKLAKEFHLTDKTINLLIDQEICTVDVLVNVETHDLHELEITRAQNGLLRRWMSEIKRIQIMRNPQNLVSDVSQLTYADTPAHPQSDVPLATDADVKQTLTNQSATPDDDVCPAQDASEHCHAQDSSDYCPAQDASDCCTAMESSNCCPTQAAPDCCTAQEASDCCTAQEASDCCAAQEASDCLRELNITGPDRKELQTIMEEQGIEGLKEFLKKEVSEFATTPVTIAVSGRSGTGKSSLINTLRNLRPSDPNAAEVGVAETTLSVKYYTHPQMPNIKLFDLPGVNTPNFTRAKYLEKVKFNAYDAFIITSTDRFTEDEVRLAGEAHKLGSPFYLVRTKIDQTLHNARRDNSKLTEHKVLEKVRSSIQSGLSQYSLPADKIYLVSNIFTDQTKWDFPLLVCEMIQNTPCKNKKAMVLAMVSCSRDLIEMKVRELQARIDRVSLRSFLSDDIDALINKELGMYRESLGITRLDLQLVDTTHFTQNLKTTIEQLDTINNRDVTKWVEMNGILYWLFEMFIPQLYQQEKQRAQDRKEKVLQRNVCEVQTILNTVLDRCKELALAVVDAKQIMAEI